VSDIRRAAPDVAFDLATLHQNIYYFPVAERVDLLRHVRSFLKTGGRVLLTTICHGERSAAAVLDLWGAMTAGCGSLPESAEMVAQIEAAGYVEVTAHNLFPSGGFYAFIGANPDGDHIDMATSVA
jgi:4-hydroxy-2,2'-bipyrrole-5-carbaldehyde O-methyltransferase